MLKRRYAGKDTTLTYNRDLIKVKNMKTCRGYVVTAPVFLTEIMCSLKLHTTHIGDKHTPPPHTHTHTEDITKDTTDKAHIIKEKKNMNTIEYFYT
jgi:hypothetical protein